MPTPCAQKVGHCVLIVIFTFFLQKKKKKKNEFKTRRQPVRLKATETETETGFFLSEKHIFISIHKTEKYFYMF